MAVTSSSSSMKIQRKSLWRCSASCCKRCNALLPRSISGKTKTALFESPIKDIVRGRIESDLESGEFPRKPLLIVDGREIGWEEFGHMLMGFEGWNFKLEIYDKSEER